MRKCGEFGIGIGQLGRTLFDQFPKELTLLLDGANLLAVHMDAGGGHSLQQTNHLQLFLPSSPSIRTLFTDQADTRALAGSGY